jgi:hypothetical protein
MGKTVLRIFEDFLELNSLPKQIMYEYFKSGSVHGLCYSTINRTCSLDIEHLITDKLTMLYLRINPVTVDMLPNPIIWGSTYYNQNNGVPITSTPMLSKYSKRLTDYQIETEIQNLTKPYDFRVKPRGSSLKNMLNTLGNFEWIQ